MTRDESEVSRLSRHDSELSGRLKPNVHAVVPTVPTVPTQKNVKEAENGKV
jgi:hypothetical protein